MYVTLIVSIVIGLVLLGLVQSSETILDIRQARRDQDHDPKIYL